jgi:glycerophosphoryl diester phosphodiesterase
MKIFAHRGVAGRGADENSLEAVRRALALGVHGIEVDVRLTRDGEVVLVHDVDFRRIAGDIRQVASMSLQEVKAVALRQGAQAITLDELTANVPAPIELDLEVKDAAAMDAVVRKLRTSAGLRERTILTSFDQEVLARASAELPDVRRGLLLRAWPQRPRTLFSWAAETGLMGVGFASRFWSTSRVAQVHAAGLQAMVWEIFGARSTLGVPRGSVTWALIWRS